MWSIWYLLLIILTTLNSVKTHPFLFESLTVSNFHNLHLTQQHAKLLTESIGCNILLVESMPQNLTYGRSSPRHASTVFAWEVLMGVAKHNLSIASFYWSLIAEPQFNQSAVDEGQTIYDALLAKAKEVNLTIAQSGAKKEDGELDGLAAAGAQVYYVDVPAMLGQGVLHTKLWTADSKHGYLGSANMDWRSLTEVKELGALVLNCPPIVSELEKIHAAYCLVSAGLPKSWPETLRATYNRTHPLTIRINGIRSRVYISGSPKQFNPPGRTFDLEAILSTIEEAKKYIFISVMDYSPEVVDYSSNHTGKYWPDIDDALRKAAIDRNVEVRLLISRWRYTSPTMVKYLTSLKSLNGIHGAKIRVRYFVVPCFTEDQKQIPHARVNHNKYMVTESTAYIGTSNWSGDYFLYTGGAALVVEEDTHNDTYFNEEMKAKTLRTQLTDIFLRDWNSEYAFEE